MFLEAVSIEVMFVAVRLRADLKHVYFFRDITQLLCFFYDHNVAIYNNAIIKYKRNMLSEIID